VGREEELELEELEEVPNNYPLLLDYQILGSFFFFFFLLIFVIFFLFYVGLS